VNKSLSMDELTERKKESLAVLGDLAVEPMREGDIYTWVKRLDANGKTSYLAGTSGRMTPEIAAAIVSLTRDIPLVIEERAELLKDRERLDWLLGPSPIDIPEFAKNWSLDRCRLEIDVAMQKEPEP
jgi:hypothetical protein